MQIVFNEKCLYLRRDEGRMEETYEDLAYKCLKDIWWIHVVIYI